MKRVVPSVFIGIALFLLVVGFVFAAQDKEQRGTIRGTVYADVDGDGRCENGQPLANIPILFVSLDSRNRVSLYTGSNGTYGLVAAGQGAWQVTAQPRSSQGTVTSANPVQVTVKADTPGLAVTGVDFCVQTSGSTSAGSAASAAAIDAGAASGGNVGNGRNAETAFSAAAASAAAVDENTPIATLSAISEALLTSDPPPAIITDTALLDPQPAVETVPAAAWLTYLNRLRTMGGVPTLQESPMLSQGARDHSRYMVVNDKPIAHNQTPGDPLFTIAGQTAGHNGNIFATTQSEADYIWGMNFWATSPFHLVPLMEPRLETVGYGNYVQETGTFHMAAVLDVRTELDSAKSTADLTYPMMYPGDGESTWLVRHSLYEWPDPLKSCAGYSRPTGAPILLQLGDGSLTPNVTGYALTRDGQPLEACLFDETSYTNPNAFEQQTGRTILGERDAVILLPRQPLTINQTYTVQIFANGETYTWSFNTQKSPDG